MITNIQIGNIYNRWVKNLATGERMCLVYKLVDLITSEGDIPEYVVIHEATSSNIDTIPFEAAMIESTPIELSRILLFYLGIEQYSSVLPGISAATHYVLHLETENIILVEEENHFNLVGFDQNSNIYKVRKRLYTLDALQNYLHQHMNMYYSPDEKVVNRARLFHDEIIVWATLIKERVENHGPLLENGACIYLRSNGCNCSLSDVKVVLKYGISYNYFKEEPSFDGMLYIAY